MLYLCYRSTRGFMHMRIVRNTEGYTLGGANTAFSNVPTLIKHYVMAQKLPVRGAEHMTLSVPLPAVLLWTVLQDMKMENFDCKYIAVPAAIWRRKDEMSLNNFTTNMHNTKRIRIYVSYRRTSVKMPKIDKKLLENCFCEATQNLFCMY